MDHKAGYDHVLMAEDSQELVGLRFGRFYLKMVTLPFGFKLAPWVYQTIGQAAVSYLRALGVPILEYLDDFIIIGKGEEQAERNVYAVAEVLSRLGYFLSLTKSRLIPAKQVKFLGMIVDTEAMAFRVPEEKKRKMGELREEMLRCGEVSVKGMQRWTGKCVSLMCAVPEARMFIREANQAISVALLTGERIVLAPKLREEISYWKFLDDWHGVAPWRRERHVVCSVSTDASMSGYAVVDKEGVLITRDMWQEGDGRPIHVKEAEAVKRAVEALGRDAQNGRLVVKVDNKAVVDAWWNYGGSRDNSLNDILKQVWTLARIHNLDIRLEYVASADNQADEMSRSRNIGDCALMNEAWKIVEETFGPHTVDGMALQSNAKTDRFFAPFTSPGAAAVDLFAQKIEAEGNIYIYPPFVMIQPVLNFLKERKAEATVVLPVLKPHPSWWPLVIHYSRQYVVIGEVGQKQVIAIPTKKGLCPDRRGLKVELRAYRLSFK